MKRFLTRLIIFWGILLGIALCIYIYYLQVYVPKFGLIHNFIEALMKPFVLIGIFAGFMLFSLNDIGNSVVSNVENKKNNSPKNPKTTNFPKQDHVVVVEKPKNKQQKKEFQKPIKIVPSLNHGNSKVVIQEELLVGTNSCSFPLVKVPVTSVLVEGKKGVNPVLGVSERKFIDALKIVFKRKVKEGLFFDVPGSVLGRTYHPDVVVQNTKTAIIIEIDEPYSGTSREPTHYINSYDVDRDNYFIENGWTVVRFAEEQIVKEESKCIFFIAELVYSLTSVQFFIGDEKIGFPKLVRQWTRQEAIEMANCNYREGYLGIEFPKETTVKPDPKVIEYDKYSARTEKPKSELDSSTTFIARENAPKEEEKKVVINSSNPIQARSYPNSSVNPFDSISSNPIQARSDSNSLVNPFDSISSNPIQARPDSKSLVNPFELSSSQRFNSNEGENFGLGLHETGSVLDKAIRTGKCLKFKYRSTVGLMKPIEVKMEGAIKYVYGKELVYGKERKFKVKEIVNSSISTLDFKEIIFDSNDNSISDCVSQLVNKAVVAKMEYSKNAMDERTHYLYNVKNSTAYNGCIDAETTESDIILTFSIKKIKSITVYFMPSWYNVENGFGLSKSYKEAEPKPTPRYTATSSSPTPKHTKTASSSPQNNNGCMWLIGVGVIGLLLLFGMVK